VGFSSVVARLAKEVRAGLDIGPVRAVFVNSEPVEDGAAESCRAAWGQSCAFHVGYGNVEGSVYAIQMLPARSRGDAAGDREPSFAMDVMDDHVVLARHPTDPQKSVVTPLWSTTPPLPLINYVIDDTCHFLDAPAQGNGVDAFPFQRIAIEGRKRDFLIYHQAPPHAPAEDAAGGRVQVHPQFFYDILGTFEEINEYQVRQTEAGADIAVVLSSYGRARGDADARAALLARVRDGVVASLRTAGLRAPEITAGVAEALQRHPETGKVTRFLPLADPAATAAAAAAAPVGGA